MRNASDIVSQRVLTGAHRPCHGMGPTLGQLPSFESIKREEEEKKKKEAKREGKSGESMFFGTISLATLVMHLRERANYLNGHVQCEESAWRAEPSMIRRDMLKCA